MPALCLICAHPTRPVRGRAVVVSIAVVVVVVMVVVKMMVAVVVHAPVGFIGCLQYAVVVEHETLVYCQADGAADM